MALLEFSERSRCNQRLVLLTEYDGSAFSGSQKQLNANSVQETLEHALHALNIKHGPLFMTGRTDAGVHSKGQVVHADILADALENIPDLLAALNAVLPETLSVRDYALTADFGFHANLSPEWRWYRYKIYNNAYRSVWMSKDALWFKHPLNVDLMNEAASCLLGTHNFESFKCIHTENANHICHVIQSRVFEEDGYIMFDIVANRFLYKMIRNIMGVLLEIGVEGAFKPSDIPGILKAQDRQKAGPTASPTGLSLMAAQYPEYWGFFKNDVYVTKLRQYTSATCSIEESSLNHEENLLSKTA